MGRIGFLLRDARGAITLGSIAIATGILSISAMVALAVSNGYPLPPAVKYGSTANMNAEGALQLTQTVALPVGSVVTHSDGSFTTFRLPDGGWLDAWNGNGTALPEGTILTTPQSFTLQDGGGLDAVEFASSISEAYSSDVIYAFK